MWVWSLWRFALLPRSRLLPQAQRLESRYRAMLLGLEFRVCRKLKVSGLVFKFRVYHIQDGRSLQCL